MPPKLKGNTAFYVFLIFAARRPAFAAPGVSVKVLRESIHVSTADFLNLHEPLILKQGIFPDLIIL